MLTSSAPIAGAERNNRRDIMLGEEYPYGESGESLENNRLGMVTKSGRVLGDDFAGHGGPGLGEEKIVGSWDFRTLPNKTLELVKNTGNMHQEGTGYFTDSEGEMLKVLAYLNYGETTGTTESMREQINEAIKKVEDGHLVEREQVDKDSFIKLTI